MRRLLFAILILSTTGCESQTKKNQKMKGFTLNDSNIVYIETTNGKITIELYNEIAPKHSENFRKLAREGFYQNTTFHRVIPGFMIQGGDPNSKNEPREMHGTGGPGYTIDAEISATHDVGVIAAARQGDNVNPEKKSSGSQFYITVADAKFLDGQYTVFGKVLEGMDVAEKIVSAKRDSRDNPLEKIEILNVTVKSDGIKK